MKENRYKLEKKKSYGVEQKKSLMVMIMMFFFMLFGFTTFLVTWDQELGRNIIVSINKKKKIIY